MMGQTKFFIKNWKQLDNCIAMHEELCYNLTL